MSIGSATRVSEAFTPRRPLISPISQLSVSTVRPRNLMAVAGMFALSRIAYALAGVRFDAGAIHPSSSVQVQWQLLPVHLLRHALGQSIWNLHSQPPLYNLFCGALLHLPRGWQTPAAHAVFVGLGLALATATFMLLEGLGCRTRTALAVTVLVIANPAVVLYENWLSWSYPTAVLLTVGALCLLRWTITSRARWAAAALSCFAAVVLIDATFQWPWLLAMAAVVVMAGRRHWRRALLAAAIPIAVTAGWYAKNAVQVGSPTTSTWLGMNLYQTTLGLAPRSDLRSLTHSGALDALAGVPPFQPVTTYAPRFAAVPGTGTAATVSGSTRLGVPNYNNAVYTVVSGRYLSDDIAYIRARPTEYASNVSLAAEIWTMPADQYAWLKGNRSRVAGFAGLYDRAVLAQVRAGAGKAGVAAELHGIRPPAATISWTSVALLIADLLVAPAVLLVRRKDRLWLVCGTAMWLTVLYSFAVTSLTEVGENMRFRLELGTIPVVLAVAAVSALLGLRATRNGVPDAPLRVDHPFNPAEAGDPVRAGPNQEGR